MAVAGRAGVSAHRPVAHRASLRTSRNADRVWLQFWLHPPPLDVAEPEDVEAAGWVEWRGGGPDAWTQHSM